MSLGYPVMLHLEGRRCLVVGGGKVAERKTAGLLDAGADVTVVSPRLSGRLSEWSAAGRIRAELRGAEPGDLDGAALVFAATDRPELNRQLAAEARSRGIPVNVADDGEAGDFSVPAVVRRGGLVLAVGTSGAGPAMAAKLAGELERRYGEEYAELVETLGKLRGEIKRAVADPAERRSWLQAAVSDEALALWRTVGRQEEGSGLFVRLRNLKG
ncbi:precorrin-2 dehydrogenase/sirohydrochlorin ferrochelatase family protein [Cohnella zeiphila]|uniref:precorrin-2 dehydrogenase n=1 Tax=Cohnella zeiphila TaxID=2761120 RepID=A0A7X0VTF1_9BACL|nr:bifunctional precorrin-2 dehydrogenase/sirohydrochlorin ferrochelatase [Cohnella zeiphila]MBB6729295.1 bifunctional precorrin-2 dehydrogenase/sirohydrochlorin ferrochelatase [Cohnella zeiphila]